MTAAEMKYMRITAGYTWDRLQNNCTNCKGFKNNTNFGQITGIQEKLDTTCKQNASKQITQGNETLLSNRQKESWQTFEETSGYVRPERVNKWPISMREMMMMMMMMMQFLYEWKRRSGGKTRHFKMTGTQLKPV